MVTPLNILLDPASGDDPFLHVSDVLSSRSPSTTPEGPPELFNRNKIWKSGVGAIAFISGQNRTAAASFTNPESARRVSARAAHRSLSHILSPSENCRQTAVSLSQQLPACEVDINSGLEVSASRNTSESSRISSTSGSLSPQPLDTPTSTRNTEPSHAELIPPAWMVWPTIMRLAPGMEPRACASTSQFSCVVCCEYFRVQTGLWRWASSGSCL
mmetsp:Transcript_14555/g.40965  ORF Transcript_14555/g.40965 Transcript_14555/m.40965 type:complete len:215 (-) Transcript_14555:981-1625(-)